MSTKARKRIGDYEILQPLAGGGQASIYKARHATTGEIVAVKLSHVRAENEEVEKSFRREADILQRISHRNIVQYRDSFTCEDEWGEPQRCLVMELLEGGTLKEHLDRYPKGIPWKEAKYTLQQCLEGLIHVRDNHGITHRDIKPSNIFILRDGTVKLLDFGIARVENDETQATADTEWLGSFDYMAPDYVLDEAPSGDEISDIFSLTVSFYQAVTGRFPFPKFGDRPELDYFERWSGATTLTPSHAPIAFRVIRHLTAFVDKGLKVNRAERYRNYEEMLQALQTLKARTIHNETSGDYELLEGIGKGGFGEVYKARRSADDKIVAIKRLFSDHEAQRFLKEGEILRSYRHPNMVDFIDSFQGDAGGTGRSLFLVLEYLEGMPGLSLSDRIKKSPDGIRAIEALRAFAHCLDALAFLHDHQVIHRDIKPGNIYAPIGDPSRAKILDLGIARDVGGTNTHGTIPGTWDYMAPEFVLDSSRGSAQSDIYAMGLTLYEALTGKPAFPRITGSGQKAITEFVARATGNRPVEIDFDLPVFHKYPKLKDLILTATARDMEKRFQSCAMMRAGIIGILVDADEDVSMFATSESDLEMIEKLKTDAPQQESAPEKVGHLHRIGLAAALLGIVGVIATLGYGVRSYLKPGPTPPLPVPTVTPVPAEPRTPTGAPSTATEPTTGIAAPDTEPQAGSDDRLAAERRAEEQRVADQRRLERDRLALAEQQKKLEEDRRRLEEERRRRNGAAGAATSASEDDRVRKQIDDAVQAIAMQSGLGLDPSSFDAGARDVRRRAGMIRLVVERQLSQDLRDRPQIIAEQNNFWRFIAKEAVKAAQPPADALRHLTIARGALYAAVRLQDYEPAADIVRRWADELRKDLSDRDLTGILPFPTGDVLVAGNAQSPYLRLPAAQQILGAAAILPHTGSIVLTAGQDRRAISNTISLVLVPGRDGPVNQPFYMAATEMPLGAIRAYRAGAREDLQSNGRLAGLFDGKLPPLPPDEDQIPYAQAQADDALQFCNWLSHRAGLPTVYSRTESGAWRASLDRSGFRLPTQTEWEHAARFGFDWNRADGVLTWKELEDRLQKQGSNGLVWFYYKDKPRGTADPHTVASPLGLRDMCGNVAELCMSPPGADAAPESNVELVVCGGSFKSKSAKEVVPGYSREYDRQLGAVGFRVILPMPIENFKE